MTKLAELQKTHVQTSVGPSPCKFGILSGALVAESATVTLTAIKASVTFSFTNCALRKFLGFNAATLSIQYNKFSFTYYRF